MTPLEHATTALGAFVDRWRVSMNLPGVAVAVTDRDRDLHLSTHGVADVASGRPLEPGHLFEIGSISKSFTALAVLQAAEAGRLGPDDPVAGLLPWPRVASGWQAVTVRHLLTHTSGLIAGTEATADAAPELWALRHARVTPGRFHYSNAGYKALGLILERVYGEPFPEVVHRRVMAPLGMDSSEASITNTTRRRLATGHEPLAADRPLPPAGALAAATWLETATADGNIASTVSDLTRFVRMLLNRGRGPAARIISGQAFDRMTGPAVAMADEPTDDGSAPPVGYGFGLMVFDDDGARVVGHTGGMVGYTSCVLADPQAGVGIAVLANGPGGCRRIAWHGLRLARAALAGGRLPPAPDVDPYHVPGAAAWAGRYAGDGLSLALEAAGGGLTLAYEDARIPVTRVAGGTLLASAPPFELFTVGAVTDGGRISGLAHGSHRLAKDGATLPPARRHPRRWDAFPGHYRSHNPWLTNFRVVLRGGELVLIAPGGTEAPAEEERLAPLPGGAFRPGEETGSPERVRFGVVTGGSALRCQVSGADYWRTVTP